MQWLLFWQALNDIDAGLAERLPKPAREIQAALLEFVIELYYLRAAEAASFRIDQGSRPLDTIIGILMEDAAGLQRSLLRGRRRVSRDPDELRHKGVDVKVMDERHGPAFRPIKFPAPEDPDLIAAWGPISMVSATSRIAALGNQGRGMADAGHDGLRSEGGERRGRMGRRPVSSKRGSSLDWVM